ncbi:NADP-dependent malic enzyme [Candidatus Woesearchaeota archaeon]|nr:NADP-dependent malic enzyme [Candidatus Woesearchaeota archaeon]
MDYFKESLKLHKQVKGKIEIKSKVPLKTKEDLSLAYTPGVAEPCREIAKHPETIYDYTQKGNTIAIVTDGSAVLGLGNIGAEASLPVMEGKSVLFKEFGNINCIPICIKTQDAQEIIQIVKNIAPAFGGINLEDISGPRCFEVEDALQDIGIPVFHDDQHGTAIVILAALINAAKVVGKRLEDFKIVIFGAGAAGIATAKLLLCINHDRNLCTAVKEIILIDSVGPIHWERKNLTGIKQYIAEHTNKSNLKTIDEAVKGADVLIGVSQPGAITEAMIQQMAPKPIVLALANPTPEIMPDIAKKAGAFIVGTGRSDFPNQINNVLAFPGIFRGALDAGATQITGSMKIAAAHALAGCIDKPTQDKVLPYALDKGIADNVAAAVRKQAQKEGVTRFS